MRIRDLLAAESIELNGSAAGKQDVLNKMVDLTLQVRCCESTGTGSYGSKGWRRV